MDYPQPQQSYSMSGQLGPNLSAGSAHSVSVPEVLERLAKNIEILGQVRANLTERLESITQPREPRSEDANKAATPVRPSLVNGLSALSNSLEREISEVQDIIRRLEI